MATVIDFTAKLNERRASIKQAEIDQSRQTVIDNHAEAIRSAMATGDIKTAVGHAIATVQIQESINVSTPAYCDPSNEFKGSKYEATKSMSSTEISKLIREDIKSAKKRGQLPGTLKVSVKTDYFAGGSSIDLKITALPDGQTLISPEWIVATDNGKNGNYHGVPRYTPPVQRWIDLLKEIHSSYNRDNSDSMSDYFSVNYYGDVSIDWKLEH